MNPVHRWHKVDLIQLRGAHVHEAETLSQIAHMAKAHWGYTAVDLASWSDDLTITADAIQKRPTFVADVSGKLVGFCQLSFAENRAELEHLWVLPANMGQGVGRSLLARAGAAAITEGHNKLWIDSDPNAAGFYVSRGAQSVGEIVAPIAGDPNRKRPLFCLAVDQLDHE